MQILIILCHPSQATGGVKQQMQQQIFENDLLIEISQAEMMQSLYDVWLARLWPIPLSSAHI